MNLKQAIHAYGSFHSAVMELLHLVNQNRICIVTQGLEEEFNRNIAYSLIPFGRLLSHAMADDWNSEEEQHLVSEFQREARELIQYISPLIEDTQNRYWNSFLETTHALVDAGPDSRETKREHRH